MSLFTHPGSILGDRICRGPRYLIPLLPFLMLALGTVAHRIPFWLLGITGSVSILINWTGTQYIVPQNAFGALPMFFLGGPSTQMYQFLQSYFTRYTRWEIEISPLGGWIIIGAIIWGVWYFIDRRQPTGDALSSMIEAS